MSVLKKFWIWEHFGIHIFRLWTLNLHMHSVRLKRVELRPKLEVLSRQIPIKSARSRKRVKGLA
jgi:heme exporter protein D